MKSIKIIMLVAMSYLTFYSNANEKERLICYSDRDVYVSGDTIMLKLFIPITNHSTIAYVDLANFSGKCITGVKIKTHDHQAEGYIIIPDSIRTGTYLLRSHIQSNGYMEYSVRDILIANRFEDNLQPSNPLSLMRLENNEYAYNDSRTFRINIPDTIEQSKSTLFEIQIDSALSKEMADEISISISKYTDQFISRENYYPFIKNDEEAIIEENKGLTITGKVIDKNTLKPVGDALVYLSIPDSIPHLNYYFTQDDGYFYFILKDIYEKVPIVIQAEKENENNNLKILLDNKFDTKIPIPSFKIETYGNDLKTVITNLVECFTFKKIFEVYRDDDNPQINYLKSSSFFYGEPTYTIITELYIDLPSFNEISKELLSGVKFRDQKGNLSMFLVDREFDQLFKQPPLLLVDGVPIKNLNIISKMGSAQIKWINAVLSHRFYGDLSFSGVIAVHTGNYDLKWLNESDRLIKLNYETLQKSSNARKMSEAGNIPDLRSLLFWKSGIKPSSNMKFSFKTSDINGAFRIKVFGKNNNGMMIVSEKKFTVR